MQKMLGCEIWMALPPAGAEVVQRVCGCGSGKGMALPLGNAAGPELPAACAGRTSQLCILSEIFAGPPII